MDSQIPKNFWQPVDDEFVEMRLQIEIIKTSSEWTHNEDSSISIWIGSLAAYNAGHLVGLWVPLPIGKDSLKQIMNVLTQNGLHDFEVFEIEFNAKAQDVLKRIAPIQEPYKLNKLAQDIIDNCDDTSIPDDLYLYIVNRLLADFSYNNLASAMEAAKNDVYIHYGTLEEYLMERWEEEYDNYFPIGITHYKQFYETEKHLNKFAAKMWSNLDWKAIERTFRIETSVAEFRIGSDDIVMILNS